jgi:MFS transporter, FHS family, L-fucose permease
MTSAYRPALFYMIVLFFMWGFLTELDGALIPYLHGLFKLNYFQASLVQFAFFIAFFLMSLPSAWLLDRIGYRKGIVIGLAMMAVGSYLFIAASHWPMYAFFLGAIFILASGVTLLQVASNPYVARLGAPESASSRLNLAQGFNSIAKVIAPLAGSYFILRGLVGLGPAEQAKAVQLPYLVLGTVLLLLAIVFSKIQLPDIMGKRDKDAPVDLKSFPHLLRGVVAIFLYVGAEVAIATYLVLYLSQVVFPESPSFDHYVAGLTNADDILARYKEVGARYLAFYWGGLMVGRLAGAALLKFVPAGRLLTVAATACFALMAGFYFSSGVVAMWLLIGTGLFLSIMWSNIFTLAIDGLGPATGRGSGMLVMAIVGGAVLPPIQGLLADSALGLHGSFMLTLLSFGYIGWYGWRGYQHV